MNRKLAFRTASIAPMVAFFLAGLPKGSSSEHKLNSRLSGQIGATPPTVISNVRRDMLVACDETFGPVAPLIRFNTVEDVIQQANDTIYGLAAYFYANELKKVWRVAEALEYGMVGINTGRMSSEAAPFGGMKQSGMGREGSRHGADDYLEMKYLCFGNL